MKITQIVCQILRIENVEAKTASSQDSVLVRIRTDSGLEGIGEADSSPEMVKAVIDAPFSHNVACGLREILIGENPLETERIWEKMYRGSMYAGRRSVTITAMAAIDMALWGYQGKTFWRTDSPIAWWKTARSDSGLCVDPVWQRWRGDRGDWPTLARRGLPRSQIWLGTDG